MSIVSRGHRTMHVHQRNCRRLVGSALLVGLSMSIMLLLVGLVRDSVTSGLEASANAGVGILGDVLVGLLGSTRGSTLDLVRDVVGGVLDGIHCGRLLICGK